MKRTTLLMTLAGLLSPGLLVAASNVPVDAKHAATMGYAERHDTSPPLRDLVKTFPQLPPKNGSGGTAEEIENLFLDSLLGRNPADAPFDMFAQLCKISKDPTIIITGTE